MLHFTKVSQMASMRNALIDNQEIRKINLENLGRAVFQKNVKGHSTLQVQWGSEYQTGLVF
jgi:hypothetical protein